MSFIRTCRRTAWWLALGVLVWPGRGAAQDNLATNAWFQGWDTSVAVRAATGFKKNTLLSAVNEMDSAFVRGALDLSLFRLPAGGSGRLFAFATAEQTQFFDSDGPSNERLALAQVHYTREVASDWEAGGMIGYLYQKQVFDASTTEFDLRTLPAEGHAFSAGPEVEWRFHEKFSAGLEIAGYRQLFREPLDDYWETRPELTLTYHLDRRSRVSLAYERRNRWYDSRPRRSENGERLGSGTLAFERDEWWLSARNYFQDRTWRSDAKVGAIWNRDNGGGFFDYVRFAAKYQLRFHKDPWEVRGEVGASHYRYLRQRVDEAPDPDTAPKRKRTNFDAGLEVRFAVRESLHVFTEYHYEEVFSNEDLNAYAVQLALAGVELTF